ncbi:hypothetical protein HDU82_006320 [Entophlyctis luteolus]|nr:hypothetical protein HDU82_006320 [Entophlyctis luteolus]
MLHSVAPAPTASKDLAILKEACAALHALSAAVWADVHEKSARDLRDLDALKERMLAEDSMKLLEMETVVSIVSVPVRRDILRKNMMAHMNDEKEISTSLQQHKDEFSQFVLKRRIHSKKEMRSLFSNGSGMICRLGDLVSANTLEAIQLFEQSSAVRLTCDAVCWNLCEPEDLPAYLDKKVAIRQPKLPCTLLLKPSRVEVKLQSGASANSWGCAYGTHGPSASHHCGKKMQTEMTAQALEQLLSFVESRREAPSTPNSPTPSFLCILAKIMDAVHPTHSLQTSVLAYPAYANTLLKKRLLSLGYSIAPFTEETGQIDSAFAISVLKQICNNLLRDQRFYFEVSYSDPTVFCIAMKENENNIYPGYNEHSFGFISTGEIIWQNEKKPYFSFPPRNELFVTFKTLGIMVDMYAGSISLVFDKKIQNVAFGSGARAYDSKDQLRQKCASIKDFKTNHIIREIILNSMMVPMFAMQAPLFEMSILGDLEGRDKAKQDDEEKLQMTFIGLHEDTKRCET